MAENKPPKRVRPAVREEGKEEKKEGRRGRKLNWQSVAMMIPNLKDLARLESGKAIIR